MELHVEKWKEFTLNRVFTLKGGFYNKKPEHSKDGNIPFLASTESNNGVTEYYCIDDIRSWDKVGESDNSLDKKLFDGNCIAVTVNGSVCNAFYQRNQFSCSHDITSLYLKKHEMNVYIGQFISTVIMMDKYRWNYGRKPHDVSKFGKSILKLPIQTYDDGTPILDEKKTFSDDGYIPDWQFMERYIKSLHYKRLKTKNAKTEVSDIKTDDWQEFRFGNLISKIYKAKALNKEDLLISDESSNSIRYITRTSEDNGCEFRAVLNEINPSFIEEENAITIGDTTATCFYQSEKFITGDHMVVVRADWLNKTNALFIVAILNKEQYKYSYGRAFLMDRIKDTIIKLPVKKNADGKAIIDGTHKYSEDGYIPDWEWMESYINSLPYSDRI